MHLGNHSDRLAFFGRSQPTLKQGARGEAVKTLQKQLNTLGFPTAQDGIFGFKTMATVTQFQKSRGLKPDGVVGAATWAALENKGGPVAQTQRQQMVPATVAPRPTAAPAPTPAGTPILKQGAKGAAVKQLQGMLGIKQDGVFGAGTRAAVMQFQKSRGLKADGIVGPATWAALRGGPPARVAPVAAVKKARPGTKVVKQRTTMRQGSKGPAVKELQEDLKKAGYDDVVADGVYGPKTAAAVKDFQQKQGLAPDAVAGQATQTALEQTTGSRPISQPTEEVVEQAPPSDAQVPVTVPPAGETTAKKGLPGWAWALIGVGGAGVLGGLAYFLTRKPSGAATAQRTRPAAAVAGADFEQMPGGGTIVTGRGIPLARLMALRSMLRLEMVGLQHSGGSIYARVKREFGLKGNKQKVFELFTALVEAAKAAHSGGVQ